MLHFPPVPGITSGHRAEGLFLLSFQFRLTLDLPNGLQKQPLSPPLRVRYQPAPIVNEILRAFDKGKMVVIPGKLLVRLGTLGARLLPRNVILRLAAGTVQQLNQKTRVLSHVSPI
jgi:hypothetical protein